MNWYGDWQGKGQWRGTLQSVDVSKLWQGDTEKSIEFTLYSSDGTVRHKKFNKKVISEGRPRRSNRPVLQRRHDHQLQTAQNRRQ